ncbi:MAG: adenylate/guanylate cyclase domain-containing protein [Ferruginibacter sp.]
MLKSKQRISLVLFSVAYWMLVAFYFITVRYAGLGAYAPPDLHYTVVITYGAVVGFFIGLLFGLFPLNHFLHFKKRRSFLAVVLTGTCCYIVFFMAVIFCASLYDNTPRFALRYLFSANGMTVLFHLFAASLLYHFILQANKKFGPGILLEYTFGKYFTPKEEERAFMFLDLKSSTRLAETLEHVAYSRMIQDCYAELTVPLIQYRAQVYQYVGDEVVLSWKIDQFFSGASCYGFFYDFNRRLEIKKDHFLQQYGIRPVFKAGLHCGRVTVAEVGEIKTEIAYHGDVLNTASRIQSLCNEFQKELLVSEAFTEYVPATDRRRIGFVSGVTLRGKEAVTKIYTITEPMTR